jgi:hypothetical protein
VSNPIAESEVKEPILRVFSSTLEQMYSLHIYANRPETLFLLVYVCIVRIHFFALAILNRQRTVHVHCAVDLTLNCVQ